MIISGTKYFEREHHETEELCPSCGQAALFIQRVLKFRHIYWIPVFPLGNTAFVYCAHCQWTRHVKDVDAHLRAIVKERVPLNSWKFILAYTILALVFVGSVWSSYHERTLQRPASIQVSSLTDPQPSQILVVRDNRAKLPFRILKIEDVRGDRILFRVSEYLYKDSTTAVKDAKKISGGLEQGKFVSDLLEMNIRALDNFGLIYSANTMKK